jgi:hypothetical protein
MRRVYFLEKGARSAEKGGDENENAGRGRGPGHGHDGRGRLGGADARSQRLGVPRPVVHHEISAVLTPEQRQKAEALHEKMRSHIEGIRMHIHGLADEMLEDAS